MKSEIPSALRIFDVAASGVVRASDWLVLGVGLCQRIGDGNYFGRLARELGERDETAIEEEYLGKRQDDGKQ
jgi:hypothetical protein